jgi:hypothetical protein
LSSGSIGSGAGRHVGSFEPARKRPACHTMLARMDVARQGEHWSLL